MLTSEEIDPGDYARIPSITIEGLPSDISSLDKEIIESELLKIVKQNTEGVNLAETKAIVRSDFLKTHFFENQNLNYISAIVDLPAIEQSYQIFHEYSKDENNKYLYPNDTVIILCITDPDEIIYSNFACNDIYDQQTRNSLVGKYIDYLEFDNFYAYISPDNINEITIHVLQGDMDDSTINKYTREVKSAIESLGIKPELFSYSVY